MCWIGRTCLRCDSPQQSFPRPIARSSAACDGIAIGCTWPELQFFPDILGQLLLGNVGVAVRDRLRARPARRVAALPGFPRYEALRVRNAVSHCVFLTVLAQIDHRSILNGVQADSRGLRCIFPSLTIAWYHP